MSAPRLAPQGSTTVSSEVTSQGSIEIRSYGQDPRIPNPGDLMIISTTDQKDGSRKQATEFTLRIKGSDMQIFLDAAIEAVRMWKENKEWLETKTRSFDAPDDGPIFKIATARKADQALAMRILHAK